mgnify:CR=1 FL=1
MNVSSVVATMWKKTPSSFTEENDYGPHPTMKQLIMLTHPMTGERKRSCVEADMLRWLRTVHAISTSARETKSVNCFMDK